MRLLFLQIVMVAFSFVTIVGVPSIANSGSLISNPQIYTAITMKDVGETLDLLGLKYQAQEIEGQSIVANTRLVVADGVIWFIYGYNCSQPIEECSELQFRALIETKSKTQQKALDLNLWNQQNRFVRAYRSNSGKAIILEMDVYLSGGVALGNVTDQILLWRQSLRKFSLFLENQ